MRSGDILGGQRAEAESTDFAARGFSVDIKLRERDLALLDVAQEVIRTLNLELCIFRLGFNNSLGVERSATARILGCASCFKAVR